MKGRRPIAPRRQAEEFSDTASGELSAARHPFAAIGAGIRTTAPRSALGGLLATLRDQQRGTEREIIERGKRRRQQHREFERAAQAAFALPRFCPPNADKARVTCFVFGALAALGNDFDFLAEINQ